MLFSLKQLVRKLRPVSDPAAPDPAFLAFRTNNYKLHVAETATGPRFLLHTEPRAPNMRDAVARCVAAYALETANDPLVEPVSAEANATDAAEIALGSRNIGVRGGRPQPSPSQTPPACRKGERSRRARGERRQASRGAAGVPGERCR